MQNYIFSMNYKNKAPNETAAIILATGNSSRMGKPKPLLPFDKQRNFLQKICAEYLKFGCCEIVIVTHNLVFQEINDKKIELSKLIKIIVNQHVDCDRFLSLQLGIANLETTNSLFIQNIDECRI